MTTTNIAVNDIHAICRESHIRDLQGLGLAFTAVKGGYKLYNALTDQQNVKLCAAIQDSPKAALLYLAQV